MIINPTYYLFGSGIKLQVTTNDEGKYHENLCGNVEITARIGESSSAQMLNTGEFAAIDFARYFVYSDLW